MKTRWYHWLFPLFLAGIGLWVIASFVVNYKPRGPEASESDYDVEATLVVRFEYPNAANAGGTQHTEYLKGEIERVVLAPNKHGGRAKIKTSAGWYFLAAGDPRLEGNGNCTLWLSHLKNSQPLKKAIVTMPRILGTANSNTLFFSSDIGAVKKVGVYYEKKDDEHEYCEVIVGSGIEEKDIMYQSSLIESKSVFFSSAKKYRVVEILIE